MELKIISLGQLKNNPILEIQKDYQKRILNLSKSVGFKKLLIKELPISKNSFDGKNLIFFIGGPDGFNKDILKAANKIISFGKVTWPHKLVRIMLLEQLYRGITILKNHPYHRN